MDDRLHIYVFSLVFPQLGRELDTDSGHNLLETIDRIGIPVQALSYLTVRVNGEEINREFWEYTRPPGGARISIGVMPASDAVNDPANKELLRTATVIGANLAGYLIPQAFGLSGVGEWLVRTAISIGGAWAATTLIPIVRPQTTPTYQLTSARNQARPGGVIPMVFGRQRVFPPLAALPITEVNHPDNYISLLMVAGYKPLHIDASTMKIGDVALSQFEGVEVEINDGWRHHDQITLFSGDIEESFQDIELTYAENWLTDGVLSEGVALFVTPDKTARISIDFTFPDGLGKNENNTLDHLAIGIQTQYRPYGSTSEADWITHVPDVDGRVHWDETEQITRAACIGWIEELTDYIGNLVVAAQAFPPAQRVASRDTYDRILGDINEIQTLLNVSTHLYTQISGEATAEANLQHWINVIRTFLGTLLTAIEDDRTVVDKFNGAVSALHIPLGATDTILRGRRVLGDSDNAQEVFPLSGTVRIQDIKDLAAALPNIFTTPTPGFDLAPSEAFAGTLRTNMWFRVPEGKWEVRVRRTTQDYEDDNYLDTVKITNFRVHRTYPAISDNMRSKLALIAIRVLATDQLTGSLDQFSVEVESPLYYTTDGSTWLGPALQDGSGNNVSRNPAWAMATLLTQAPNQKPVAFSQIDGANLLAFASWCTTNGFNFDHVFEQRSTVHRCLQDICRVAKASPTMRDGLYAVVHDRPQSTARGVLTLSNANNFEAGKAFQKRPQALRIGFKNPSRDWQDDEIFVYDDGFGEDGRIIYWSEVQTAQSATQMTMAALFETVERIYDVGAAAFLDVDDYTIGTNAAGTKTVITPVSSPADDFVVDRHYAVYGHVKLRLPTRVEEVNIPGLVDTPNDQDHAYFTGQVFKLGRYLLASAKLRPEVFRMRLDFEHFVFERGDRVEVQMDVVLWGLGSSRIYSLTRVSGGPNDGKVESITVEQDLALTDATGYAVRIRNSSNGVSGESTFTYASASPNTITFDTPYDDSAVNLAKGDLVAWGEPSKTTISCLVQEIRPLRDMAAEVTLIQYSPGIFEAENGPIPEFDPLISIPPNPERVRPPSPAITKVTTDESVLERDSDGSFASRIVLDVQLPEGRTREERDAASRVDAIHLQYRRSPQDRNAAYKPQWIPLGIFPRNATRLSVRDVQDGLTYDVRLRAVTRGGIASQWKERHGITVIGKTSPPPDAYNLRWEGQVLRWDYEAPVDHAGFRLRVNHGYGGSWATAAPVHSGLLLASSFEVEGYLSGERTYFVKAVDTSGNESLHAASTARSVSNLPLIHEEVRDDTFGFGTYIIDGNSTPWSADSTGYGATAVASSQSGRRFYKGRAGDPFYIGSSGAAFYDKTYPKMHTENNILVASGGSALPDGTRWKVEATIDAGERWYFEGKSPDLPLWPADLDDAFWPEDLGDPLWHQYMDWGPIHDGIPFEFDVRAYFRLAAVPSNTQFHLTDIASVLLVPLTVREGEDYLVSSTGSPPTKLPYNYPYVYVKTVQAALVDESSYPDAAFVKIGDKLTSGAECYIYDKDGTRVQGRVDYRITGY